MEEAKPPGRIHPRSRVLPSAEFLTRLAVDDDPVAEEEGVDVDLLEPKPIALHTPPTSPPLTPPVQPYRDRRRFRDRDGAGEGGNYSQNISKSHRHRNYLPLMAPPKPGI
jgi:hypothetical protein